MTVYPHILKAIKRTDADLSDFGALLPFGPMRVVPPEGVVRDPDDRNVLGAAMHLEAEIIVSGDKDLPVLESFEAIPILSPRAFLGRLDELAVSAP